ncbi:MAG: hypothetical protein H7062_17840 [Candidatus Saccharimonas sp.]|nr:hypothetical protein [Planctomycetaceae bacterium]
MNNFRPTVASVGRLGEERPFRWLLSALCLGLGALVAFPQVTIAQDRSIRPVPVERRSTVPVPLESGLAPPIAQPFGTVPPMAIGPAPAFYPPPVVFVPPPGYFGRPLFAPSPFLPPPASPFGPQPLPQATNYPPLVPIPEPSNGPFPGAVRKALDPSNLRVSVSEAFLNRLVAREEIQPGEVQDNILGAHVTGRQTTTSRLKVDLLPSADQGRAAFVLTGDVQTLTTGVTPQAMIDTAGQQQFVAVKDVFFDGRVFSTKHATVHVRARNQTLGAMTPLSGSLFGGLADRIAYRAAERRKPESEAIARDRVVEKVYPAFDGEIDKKLTTANQLLEQTVRKRLETAKLAPTSQSVCTTDNCLTYAALIGSDAANTSLSPLDGQLAGDGGLNLSVHESLLNDVIGRPDLQGFKTTDEELKKQTADLLAMLEGVKSTLPDDLTGAAPLAIPLPGLSIVTDIEFDETDPLTVRFDRDRMRVTMKAKFKPAGQDLLPPMKVVIEYQAVVEGNSVRCVPGKPRVTAQDQTDLTAEPTLAEMAIQKSIESALPTLEFDRTLPSKYWRLNGPAPRVTSIKSQDGWVSIAID